MYSDINEDNASRLMVQQEKLKIVTLEQESLPQKPWKQNPLWSVKYYIKTLVSATGNRSWVKPSVAHPQCLIISMHLKQCNKIISASMRIRFRWNYSSIVYPFSLLVVKKCLKRGCIEKEEHCKLMHDHSRSQEIYKKQVSIHTFAVRLYVFIEVGNKSARLVSWNANTPQQWKSTIKISEKWFITLKKTWDFLTLHNIKCKAHLKESICRSYSHIA